MRPLDRIDRCAPITHRESALMATNADRDLLFGLLALQNGLIDQAQLVAAFQAWTLAKSRALAGQLIDQFRFMGYRP
jgi:hypothetical protein